MADNIDMMIKNQEKAEILQDKTGNNTYLFLNIFKYLLLFFYSESLAHNANAFQKNSNQLKKTMWWKNVKLMLIIGAIIAIVVIVLIVIIVLAVK